MSKRPVVPKMRGVDNLLTMDRVDRSLSDLMTLETIVDRPMDTRPLNQEHVVSLAASIGALGLIQPIAVDVEGRLLAGGHRLAALSYLRQNSPDVFAQYFETGIPVRRYDFDANADPDLALAIEATENEKRRDYTAAEVRELAERLKAAGYHHTKGRAKTGDKPLLPSLAEIVGKSERQIKRYLAEEPVKELNGTDVPFSQKYLKQAIAALEQFQKADPHGKQEQRLLKELPALIEKLRGALEES